MDRRQDYGGPSPPSLLSGAVHVHRVHTRVAGEGSLPRFLAGVPPSVT
jgi:hypothetical protein